jgi:hypothetical protein
MKNVLPVALLLALATAMPAQAQERSQIDVQPANATVQVEQADVKDGAPRADNAKVGIDAKQIMTESRVAEDAIVRQDPTSTSWWWLVGAIVLAGVIIVAIT